MVAAAFKRNPLPFGGNKVAKVMINPWQESEHRIDAVVGSRRHCIVGLQTCHLFAVGAPRTNHPAPQRFPPTHIALAPT